VAAGAELARAHVLADAHAFQQREVVRRRYVFLMQLPSMEKLALTDTASSMETQTRLVHAFVGVPHACPSQPVALRAIPHVARVLYVLLYRLFGDV
jgi:hypothetical protein